MAKQKYKVLGPIGKPGKPEHKEGDTLELDPKDANTERLLRVGAIKEASAQAPSAPAGGDQTPTFDATNVADDELKGLKRDALEQVAAHEGVEKISEKNMTELIDEILEIRKAKGQE